MSSLLMFLPLGDSDYFPQVQALSHLQLGETVLKEFAGSGIRSFPIASTAVHSLLFGVWGVPGFIASTILFHVLFFYALCRVLVHCGVPSGIARVGAFFVALELPVLLLRRLSQWSFFPLKVTYWDTRFPRSLISEVIVLFFLGTALLLIGKHQVRLRRQWMLAGLLMGLLIQSDIHQAINMMMLTAVVFLWLVIEDWASWPTVVLNAVSMGILTLLTAIPFLIQRWYEDPDIPARFGLILVDRLHPIAVPGTVWLLLTTLVSAALIASAKKLGWKVQDRPVVLLLVLCGIAVVSCPFSLFVLGKGIQINHFEGRAELINSYVMLLALSLLAAAVLGRRHLLTRRIELGAIVIVAIAGAVHAASGGRYMSHDELPISDAIKMDSQALNLGHYKSAFFGLSQELESGRYDGLNVLATFDAQIANWWTYRGRYLFLVDPFNSTASDRVMEDRFIDLAHVLQVNVDDFSRLIGQQYILWRYLGTDKYQASKAYTFAPLEDYDPDSQALIRKSLVSDTWQVLLPVSERKRLVEKFESNALAPAQMPELDIVVMSKDGRRSMFHPDEAEFDLTYQNERFEIWKRRR